MRAQREQSNKVPAIAAFAESLPFDDKSFDATMAIITLHHWKDKARGLAELKRVARKRVLIMTFDPDAFYDFWTVEYFREMIEAERKRFPSIDSITSALGGKVEVLPVVVPFNCIDGFMEAFYGRPEAFLHKHVRAAQSAWGLMPELENEFVSRLKRELDSGEWDRKHGHLRTRPDFSCTLRLIVSEQGRWTEFYAQVRACIEQGGSPPVSARDGREVIRVIEAALASSERGQRVML
jgi:SAM-dependent methyltransferase